MLSRKNSVKTTLFTGSAELSKSFMFEAAINWAEEGRRVIYITPIRLESLPAACHDRSDPAAATLKLMRFMYLSNYEALAAQLVELHIFATIPSMLLIDDLDHYIEIKEAAGDEKNVHIAKLCALLLDTMNSCSRILKRTVHLCAWSTSSLIDSGLHMVYFRNVWHVTLDQENKQISVQKSVYCQPSNRQEPTTFMYHMFQDGSRILKEVLREMEEDPEPKEPKNAACS